MALDLTKLTGSPGLPGAGERDYPATGDACADEWADALGAYAATIVPPSTTVAAATNALKASLRSAFAGPPDTRLALLTTALVTWAAAIGAGMAPFIATPPAGTPFATAFLSVPPTRALGVANVAASVHLWMLTGIAVQAPAAAVTWT